MGGHENIPILLAEYNTLRAEIISRYTGLVQSTGIAAATLLAIVSLAWRDKINEVWWLAGFALVIYVGIWLWVDYDTYRAAARIRVLEAEINRRAGERLLVWETKFGGGRLFLGQASATFRNRPTLPCERLDSQ